MTQQETDGQEYSDQVNNAPQGKLAGRRWSSAQQREKVSGKQLEARFDQWSSSTKNRLAARTSEQNGSVARRALAVVLLMAMGFMAISMNMQDRAHEEQVTANQQRIDQLDTDLQVAEVPVEPKDVKTEVSNLSTEVAAASRRVAQKQQRYAELYFTSDNSPSPGNGVPTKADLEIASHRRSLAGLFAPDTFQVAGDKAYQWTSVVDVEPDKVDPRYDWYIRYNGLKVADPKTYTWQVESAMPSLSQEGQAEVVWVCRTTEGETLAWARASYDSRTKVFTDLDLVVTRAGQADARTTGGPPVAAVPELTPSSPAKPQASKSPSSDGGQ